MIRKNKKKITKVLLLALILAMALISFQLRKTQGFEPEPVAEEISPKLVFMIGPLQVTSTVINTWIMMVLLTVGAFFLGRSLKIRPGMVQNAIEWLFEAIQGIISKNIGTKNTATFFPIVATFTIFIGTANLFGTYTGIEFTHDRYQHTTRNCTDCVYICTFILASKEADYGTT